MRPANDPNRGSFEYDTIDNPLPLQQAMNAQPTTPAVTIPSLRSWTKEGNTFTLFRAGIGYLHIKRIHSDRFELTVRPDLDGTNVGPAQPLAERTTAAQLVEVAQQLYTTTNDRPVKHNTFQ